MIAQALTIAGSDPSGGAGIQMDLKVFESFGVWGWSAVTALTVQTPAGVAGWEAVPAPLLAAQVEASTAGRGIVAAKTGMLPTAEAVAVVAGALDSAVTLVVDPVLAATTGQRLTRSDVLDAIRAHLLPRARLIAPNAPEAAALTGIDVRDRASQTVAARALRDAGAAAALVTGGHLDGDEVVDVLVDDRGDVHEMGGPRARVGDVRGTGCALTAAITALLAGAPSRDLAAIVADAREFVVTAIARSVRIGDGARVMFVDGREAIAGQRHEDGRHEDRRQVGGGTARGELRSS